MTADELRHRYLNFFRDRGHAIIGSAPLVPENDPTVLFTTAGMHPLVPYLLGTRHPQGTRLANCQKCIRTGDIDEVGDTTHLTFFEMLGNWSLGDYFKEEAITLSFEFLTGELGIPLDRLHVSCFAGDEDAPRDEEAARVWRELGVPEERINFLGKKDNWWGPAGQTGPCGPDTEMFYDTGVEACGPECDITCNCGKYVEIWNDVFMQYNKTAEGTYEPLEQKNVDTGMGVERVAAVLQGKSSCYETELFRGLFDKITEITGMANPELDRGGRIIAEHMRAATFLLGDGVVPGNVDQGYVLRRLIRRAIRQMRAYGVDTPFANQLATVVIDQYGCFYKDLADNRHGILAELEREEAQFAGTLERGIREFNKLVDSIPAHVEKKQISGRKAFFLYETYGFPLELTKEMAAERGFTVDEESFQKAYRKHQEASRAGAEKKFKGGLADNTEKTARLHTATHLLHEALRRVLGDHVKQAGSNITEDRLRFDFTHDEKMTPEQKREVEDIVNDAIRRDLPVSVSEMTLDEARARGAMGLFEDRYGERVKVYSVGDFSCEVCGGPHAERTGDLGSFQIKKEESSSRGVRRIKAVLQAQE
ncbi:MAG: alanine--tRNA ligase [Verrucomicrobiota bacterium]